MGIREEFEALEDVKQGLRHCHYNESTNDYHADIAHEETHEWHTQFVNGAWYAFQEQQKKIDLINQYTGAQGASIKMLNEERIKQQNKIDEAKKEINNFFDNQTQKPTDREYCNKLADILEILK